MKDENKIIRELTNEALASNFSTELGQKATVEHHALANDERMDQLRNVLRDIGRDFQETNKVPQALKYMGSLSVHVYASEALKGGFQFVGLNAYDSMPYALADAALQKLRGDVTQTYAKARQKKRSGF